MNAPQNNAAASLDPSSAKASRRKGLLSIAALVVIAGAGWAAYEWLVSSHYETTDNALCARQPDSDHAADQWHRHGHPGRRHGFREGWITDCP